MFDTNKEFFDAMLKIMKEAEELGEEMFLDVPDAWFEPKPKWRCRNDHVSSAYLKSEALRDTVCLLCYEPVTITFPEDVDGMPLNESLELKRK